MKYPFIFYIIFLSIYTCHIPKHSFDLNEFPDLSFEDLLSFMKIDSQISHSFLRLLKSIKWDIHILYLAYSDDRRSLKTKLESLPNGRDIATKGGNLYNQILRRQVNNPNDPLVKYRKIATCFENVYKTLKRSDADSLRKNTIDMNQLWHDANTVPALMSLLESVHGNVGLLEIAQSGDFHRLINALGFVPNAEEIVLKGNNLYNHINENKNENLHLNKYSRIGSSFYAIFHKYSRTFIEFI